MSSAATSEPATVQFRQPCVTDASAILRLVRESGILDCNSLYLYLLLCRNFAATCAVAERSSQIVGFVTAFRLPDRSDTLFVWQLGVARSAQRQGIAGGLLDFLLPPLIRSGIRYVEATISESNIASRRTFDALANRFGTVLKPTDGFPAECFPSAEGAHEAEPGIRIGPFTLTQPDAARASAMRSARPRQTNKPSEVREGDTFACEEQAQSCAGGVPD
ncbi:MAG: diaminobutyrate acetyltransferase [Planctomycetaceae bacterium]